MDVAELLIAAFTLSAMGYYWLKKHGYIRAASKHSVNSTQEWEPRHVIATAVAEPSQVPAKPIAIGQNEGNGALPVAESGNEFDELDIRIARAVARLIVASEKQPFTTGKIGETRAIEIVWQCRSSPKPGSVYQEARELLKRELAIQRGEIEYIGDMVARIEREEAKSAS